MDNFLDDLWHKVDNKELSSAITELRDAINLLNQNWLNKYVLWKSKSNYKICIGFNFINIDKLSN